MEQFACPWHDGDLLLCCIWNIGGQMILLGSVCHRQFNSNPYMITSTVLCHSYSCLIRVILRLFGFSVHVYGLHLEQYIRTRPGNDPHILILQSYFMSFDYHSVSMEAYTKSIFSAIPCMISLFSLTSVTIWYVCLRH